MLAPVRPA